jgi:hypothetical protein
MLPVTGNLEAEELEFLRFQATVIVVSLWLSILFVSMIHGQTNIKSNAAFKTINLWTCMGSRRQGVPRNTV